MDYPRSARQQRGRSRAASALAVAVVATGLLIGALAPAVGATAQGPAVGRSSATARATQAQRDSVLRLYRAYFLRAPDSAGLAYWAEQYASGRRSLASISEFFARSDEFRARYGSLSDAEFVRLVYLNVLGRLPDSQGQSHWTGVLRRGSSRGLIMLGFSESAEFQRKTGTVPPEKPKDPNEPSEAWAADLLRKLNAERARYGLPPLTSCPRLVAAAVGHSVDQARNNQISHVGSNGSQFFERIAQAGYGGSAWGENVAGGHTSTEQVLAAWMASATHRQNLLSRTFQHIGLARATSSTGTLYWTQDFGAGGAC